MDDLATDPASACFLLLPVPCPDICPSHEAIKQTNPVSLQDIDARNIDIYLQEARSPDCCFVGAFPSFRFWQAGEWQLVEFSSTSLHQDTSEPNPRLRYRPFDFHVTASLLGKIATAFCRDGQPERPGDLIC